MASREVRFEAYLPPKSVGRQLAAILSLFEVDRLGLTCQGLFSVGRTCCGGSCKENDVDPSALTVDGARLVATDVAFDGGLVHVIDTVMLPELRSIEQLVAQDDRFTTLRAAIAAAGLGAPYGNSSGIGVKRENASNIREKSLFTSPDKQSVRSLAKSGNWSVMVLKLTFGS